MIGRQLRRASALLRQLNALRSNSGSYRYFVRHWHDVSDLNLLAAALGSDYFRTELTPLEGSLGSQRRILMLAPHQDDETFGAGGALVRARDAGCEIHVLYVTDGAARHPDYAESSEAGVRVRFEEAERVCRRLRATIHRLDVSNIAPAPTAQDLTKLRSILVDIEPHVVLTPWLFDMPCKHRMVNHILAAAASGLSSETVVWNYQVHTPIVANLFVDITDAMDEKKSLLEEFHSQNDYAQNYPHLAEGVAAWNSRMMPPGPSARYAELFFALPLDEFVRLVRDFYLKDLRHTYRGDPSIQQTMAKLPWPRG